MKGITIRDRDHETGNLSVTLADILSVVGNRALSSVWLLQEVECAGGSASAELHAASDSGRLVGGTKLAQLAVSVNQVIDGTFRGFRTGEQVSWIEVRAVDSSSFDVLCEDDTILATIKARFGAVHEIPG
jgi:hypothetical protein